MTAVMAAAGRQAGMQEGDASTVQGGQATASSMQQLQNTFASCGPTGQE